MAVPQVGETFRDRTGTSRTISYVAASNSLFLGDSEAQYVVGANTYNRGRKVVVRWNRTEAYWYEVGRALGPFPDKDWDSGGSGGVTPNPDYEEPPPPAPVASLVLSTLTASNSVLQADGVSNVTVTLQLIDTEGLTYTISAGTVVMNSTVGSMGAVTDHNNGTYTALLTSNAEGDAVISATLNGSPFTDTASVLIVAASDYLELSGIQIIGDDFSTYADTAAFQAVVGSGASKLYNDGPNRTLVVLDNTVQYNGHGTVRYDMPVGSAAPPQLWPTIRNWPLTTSNNPYNAWFKGAIRFSPNFTIEGTNSGVAPSYKVYGALFSSGSISQSTRIEFAFTTARLYQNGTPVYFEDVGSDHFMDLPDILDGTGDWWHIIVNRAVESAPNQLHSRLWFWRLGDPVPTSPTAERISPERAGQTITPINYIQLGLNYNKTRPAQISLWWGMWEVVDGLLHPNPFNLVGG